jgi:hypothetical protein
LVFKIKKQCWAPVAHTCNPSYSGGRDQENHSSKASLGKLFTRPYLKKKKTLHKNRAGGVAGGEGLSSSPSTTK